MNPTPTTMTMETAAPQPFLPTVLPILNLLFISLSLSEQREIGFAAANTDGASGRKRRGWRGVVPSLAVQANSGRLPTSPRGGRLPAKLRTAAGGADATTDGVVEPPSVWGTTADVAVGRVVCAIAENGGCLPAATTTEGERE